MWPPSSRSEPRRARPVDEPGSSAGPVVPTCRNTASVLTLGPPSGRRTEDVVALDLTAREPAIDCVPSESWHHGTMTKNITVRLPDELAAEAEAVARAEGHSLNETVKEALAEAVERKRRDPAFKKRLRQIIEHDRELLERLAK